MKRDMELVRRILEAIIENNLPKSFSTKNKGYNTDKVKESECYIYHLEIMQQAGLIEYKGKKDIGGLFINDTPRLTWIGNDFYEAIADDRLWNKIKESSREKGLEITKMSFDVILEYAKLKSKELLGI